MKAMDVWMLGAISFLFGALAELAVISYMIRSDKPINSPSTKRRFCRYTTGFGGVVGGVGGGNASKFRRNYYSSTNGYVSNYQSRLLLMKRSQQQQQQQQKNADNSQLLPKHLRCNCASLINNNECRAASLSSSPTSAAVAADETKDYNCNNEKSKCKRVNSRWKRLKALLTAYNVDKFFLIVYLPTFLVFNFIFWTYYL